MAEFHLEGARAKSQRHELVPQANAKGGHARFNDFARGGNGVVARLRVARAVGEENAIRLHGQHFGGRRLRGHHRHLAAARGQHAQDVVFHAEVIGHHAELRLLLRAVAAAGLPFGLRPAVGLGGADFLGQIQPGHAGGAAGGSQRLLRMFGAQAFAGGQRQHGAVLRALGAQQAGELARVKACNGNRALARQVLRQRFAAAEIAGQQRQVFDHQTGGLHAGAFHVFGVHAVIANVRIRQGDDLLAVAGVGEDFLITGHGGVEHHFAHGHAGCANGLAGEHRAVGKRKKGWGEFRLKGG